MQFTHDHEQIRDTLKRYIDEHINPHVDEWEEAGIFPAHQVFKGLGAPMYITDQIVTARGIEHQSPPPPKRLPQPSLVLHTS